MWYMTVLSAYYRNYFRVKPLERIINGHSLDNDKKSIEYSYPLYQIYTPTAIENNKHKNGPPYW